MDEAPPFFLVGNHPAIDLVNTTPRLDGRLVDLIETPVALSDWLEQAALPGQPGKAAGTRKSAAGLPETLPVRGLRDHLRNILDAVTSGTPFPRKSLEAINARLARQPASQKIEWDPARRTFRATISREIDDATDQIAIAVAEAMVHLLTDADLTRLRKCENEECTLYFLDTSKSGARRWCSMAGCGNRHKVAAHYARTKQLKM